MTRGVKWAIPLVLIGGAAIAFFAFRSHAKGADAAPPTTDPAKTEEKPPPGHLKLKPEDIEHAGIKTEALEAGTFAPETKLYGMLAEDPAASFTLRAPAAGIIVANDKTWPSVGQMIGDKTALGQVQQRLAPADQIALTAQQVTLQTQLTTAQADEIAAQIALEAAKASYDRLKALNAQDKNVSDRVVEEALTKVKTEEAHLQAARKTVELIKSTLASPQMKAGALPLEVEKGGEVADVTARPGESVESGVPILRAVDFRHLMASVYVTPGEALPSHPKQATIVPIGFEGKPLTGTFAGPGAAADPKTHQPPLLFKFDVPEAAATLRPGVPVTASVPAEGEPLKGVAVSKSAVVRYLGKVWVYVVAPDGGFDRKEISADRQMPDGSGFFVIEGLKPGDQIVTTGAASLLSQEINAAFGGGGD
jgi:multidrug efflux pump subunit AcrA (membrane-fusion protein)